MDDFTYLEFWLGQVALVLVGLPVLWVLVGCSLDLWRRRDDE